METGILGFIGTTVFAIGVLIALGRTLARGRGDQTNDTRFMLLIGPAAYVVYALMANAALNNASLNTWTVLVASMLALAPPFETHARVARFRPALTSRRRRPLAPRTTFGAAT
jgi:hypothetical protein